MKDRKITKKSKSSFPVLLPNRKTFRFRFENQRSLFCVLWSGARDFSPANIEKIRERALNP
jgi:hypothetical protein